jgi:hypothetical protein
MQMAPDEFTITYVVGPTVLLGFGRSAATFTDVVELRLGSDQGVTLVRPDGYIAYSAHNRDGIAALGSERSLLEGQTKSGMA